jgi:hypothetical protein
MNRCLCAPSTFSAVPRESVGSYAGLTMTFVRRQRTGRNEPAESPIMLATDAQ